MNLSKRLLVVVLLPFVVFLSRNVHAQAYACVETNLGEFCMELLTADAPNTVANFLKYVGEGDYNNTFIHRSVPDFAVQGGGYKLDPLGEAVPADAPIANEFKLSNQRGTVAMAKFANEPDSASSEWFVNLTDNIALDTTNGGFTVFARVVKGMNIVDAIGALGRVDLRSNLGGTFGEVPVLRKDADGVGMEDLVQVLRVYGTDTVVAEPESPSEQESAAAEQYVCTASWVASLAPTQACMDSNVGSFCIDLYPWAAPLTVANFLHYVADGDYNNTIIHRSVPGFVVQGGGYRMTPLAASVPTDPAVVNEFSVANTRGTMAMAKVGGSPDSATSQWFVNLGNNAQLDEDNGGYTVFGNVDAAGLAVFDQIGALPRMDLSNMLPGMTELPLLNTVDGLSTADLVQITHAYIPGAGPNPCLVPKPAAVTEFVNQAFDLPVRIGDQLYHMFFVRDVTSPGFLFNADLARIRTLVDTGQPAAVYTPADGFMVIPSVLAGQTVLTNVILRASDPFAYQFVLHSYNQP